ncbi:NAD(P)-dependent dehydrogenase (short-subunit alcohol dehydrogenase family) [Paucimonas lemoignei]|uniref:NAD(P)-dependent dehydrogenase (Short-subunit alcohol dehydrogenase family) n=1 Tax=Paucimonas lemoignei TaxID=29443 RepID=A0A4R3I311_PAULE|nr:SDR family oxidoreductase [Paucimonas lemoignei]TCS39065.1 NAD(P)-dependent dehydrogenase (short-subunit alcohol dehydrogenase family) [Paucimonas lemoignei]
MGRLEGKVAIITGAGSGIGRASAILFAQEGAKVIVAERDEAAGRETVRQAMAQGGTAMFVATDVTDEKSVENMVRATVGEFGKLNVLYNNVGGSSVHDNSVTEAPLEEFWRSIKIDLFGTWLGCRYGIPEIIKAGGGSVINTTSVFALTGIPKKDSYTAAKGAISALTRSMAVEYAPQKVRVNALAPGATSTDRILKVIAEDNGGVVNQLAKGQMLGLPTPHEIACAALYLASDESRVTTGQILPIDGGFIVA